MCTNTKIHAALLKTKTQTIAKMKYLVQENPKKKKKKKNKLILNKLTKIEKKKYNTNYSKNEIPSPRKPQKKKKKQ